ncbi:MAG TPA: type II secretion system secretin GspD [Xanthomonadaceae bacterium]|nr:type II secretion system secretin GspD [Xanthomonadaceae bacterium]
MHRLLLIALLALAPVLPATAQNGEMHTLNLRDADIHVLIDTVSEITGRNFIVDPRVEGRVTVVSARPMPTDEIWETFVGVLRVHGYVALESGRMWRILPEPVARQDGAPLPSAARVGADELVTRIIELDHVAALEVVTVLRPLLPQGQQIAVHGASNAIIISDRAGNVARIEAILRRIDTASEGQVEVIALRHASASEIARTLTLLHAGEASRFIADERSNSILLSGDRGGRLRARALITHLDTPLESGGDTQVIFLRYASAEDLVPILDSVAATLTGQNAEGARAATIQPHRETNALVVTAPAAVHQSLAAVVRQLDIRRAQVLIEAIIVEVADEIADEIGIQWQSTDLRNTEDGGVGRGIIGGTNFPGQGGAGGILGAAINPLTVGSGLNIGYVRGTIRLPGSDKDILQIGALARALRGDGRSNILSTPSVLTLDHHEAVFKVGQEVPFLTGQFTGASGGTQPDNPFQTIDRRDVGLTLTVTPHINEGDAVRLDIKQEVSSLAPQPVGAVDLVTNKRELTTSVLVQDGALLVLGGLITEDVRENVSKVPALGDIPVLGKLFRYRSTRTERRNLMVFLRPVILRDEISESSVSSAKYNFIRAEQLRARERSESERLRDAHPVLPEQE